MRNQIHNPISPIQDAPPAVPASVIAVLLLVVAGVFGPSASFDFVPWDDDQHVYSNDRYNPPTLANLAKFWKDPYLYLYIPVTYTVWGALAWPARLDTPDATGSRLNPFVYHSANVFVHAANVLLVFAILRRLTRRNWPAAAGAILFAVHPVQVEAICWVSGMKDLMCGLFAFLSLWQYILYAQGRDDPRPVRMRRHAVSLACFALAMLAKPAGMVVPLMAIVIDWVIIGRPLRIALAAAGPWLAMSLPFIFITKGEQPTQETTYSPPWSRPLIAADAVAFYLYRLVLPFWPSMDYGRSPRFVLAHGWQWWTWIAPAGIAVAIWLRRKRRPWMIAAALLFVVGVLPVLGLVPFSFQFYSTVGDRYLYLSMLGPAFALAMIARGSGFKVRGSQKNRKSETRMTNQIQGQGPGIRILLTALLFAFAAISLYQSFFWRDGLALFTQAIKITPESFAARKGLGVVYARMGNGQQAIREMRHALSIWPHDPMVRSSLAIQLLTAGQQAERAGRPAEALQWYIQAREQYETVFAMNDKQPPDKRSSNEDIDATRQRLRTVIERVERVPATQPAR